MMLLSSAETGEPLAFFADGGHLTDVRTAAAAAMAVRELGRHDSAIGILGSGVQARLLITVTPSRQPLLRAGDLQPGTHISAVGSDSAGKQELDVEILRRASLLLADSRRQCEKLGELQHAPPEWERAIEIGAFCDSGGRTRTRGHHGLRFHRTGRRGPVPRGILLREELGVKIEPFEMERMQSTWETSSKWT
jgi:ornithine cyclodeaminase/alanine dehydrogenase-like protein (mu-crystallin family)